MDKFNYFQQLNDRDLNILEDLYNYRAMTTAQIKKKYFPDSKYYVNKVLHNLRKDKFISTKTLKGSRKNKRGISYHYLTETGLECLSINEKSVEGIVQNLYVKPSQLHYIFLANDLRIELEKAGWEVWDSRRLKKEYHLDSRMNILGLLRAPDGREYGFYILEKGILPTTLGRVQAEIRDHHSKIKNYIIFSNGPTSHNAFISAALAPTPKRVGNRLINPLPLYTGNELKVVPNGTGLSIYKTFPTRKAWLTSLSKFFGFRVLSDRRENSEGGNTGGVRPSGALRIPLNQRQAFDVVIQYKGEEMYLVDLIESDLNLLQDVNKYNENDYLRENNRKLLVITLSIFQKEWITNDRYVINLELGGKNFKKLIGENWAEGKALTENGGE